VAGATVVRVESRHRPDGSRSGSRSFDDVLHAGQPSFAFDLTTLRGREELCRVTEEADIVVTSARQRGLDSLGLDPDGWLTRRASGVWVRISAYGSTGRGALRIGFGDDVAMGAGLVARDPDGRPMPCGDALADPLTGIHAALVAEAAWQAGGCHLVDVSMRDVVRSVVRTGPEPFLQTTPIAAEPRARTAHGHARPPGADNDAWSTYFGPNRCAPSSRISSPLR
jgi:crotonobetainyl-CoA:carnitine CoA-transferase CaiB-like acyl-CoA transferase